MARYSPAIAANAKTVQELKRSQTAENTKIATSINSLDASVQTLMAAPTGGTGDLTRAQADQLYIQETERTDFATAAQGTLADSALQTVPSTYDTRTVADGRYATTAQGTLADSALQSVPTTYDTRTVADSRYIAETDRSDFATAAQGTRADSALQSVPATYDTRVVADARYATAAQGTLAGSALQSVPATYDTRAVADTRYSSHTVLAGTATTVPTVTQFAGNDIVYVYIA